MRNFHRFCLVLGIFAAGLHVSAHTAEARIEAIKGKRYRLTKQHGPWMIMVATIYEPPVERRAQGMTPQEAADLLVYELRRKGIPAYTFAQNEVVQRVPTIDRQGRPQERLAKQEDGICVIAGNYTDVENGVAQKTLEYIKKFKPTSWEDQGVFKPTPGRPGPLSGAFLTVNPMMSPEEARQAKVDPLLLKLNSGIEYSLLENPAKYSLIVASFYGNGSTKAQVGTRVLRKSDQAWRNSRLDVAGEEASQLVRVLRARNFNAFVYHERYRSIVTVGMFESPNDPKIAKGYEIFRAKVRHDPLTGRDVLTGENIAAPGNAKTWVFDPNPTLIDVPQFHRNKRIAAN